MNNDSEIWKPIPGYEGLYSVSNHGRVMRTKNRTNAKSGYIFKPISRTGYLEVGLRNPTGKKILKVHRLVMAAFVGPCPPGMEVNHKDGNKKNNNLENLEYVTKSENLKHSYRIGLRSNHHGTNNPPAKLTDEQVLEIRQLSKSGISQRKLGEMFGVVQGTISLIVLRKSWTHI